MVMLRLNTSPQVIICSTTAYFSIRNNFAFGMFSWFLQQFADANIIAGIVYPTGHLYVKSDVYGFGVVLLELMTGLRALDTKRLSGQQNLVDWLRPTLSLKKKVKTIMDVRIEGQYSSKAAILSAELTLKCLEHDPKNRPSMKEVGEALERIESLNKEKSKDSSKSGSNHSTTPRHGQHSTPHRSPLQSRRRGASTWAPSPS